MKKILLFSLICFFSGCVAVNYNRHDEELSGEKKLGKEGRLRELYSETVVPLFEGFKNVNIPTSFQVDQKDISINAGAAFEHIEVSMGLINLENEPIQIFVLAHEISHLAVLEQAQIFGLQGELPKESQLNNYKKTELISDLIAIHLIKTNHPVVFDLIEADFSVLQEILGPASFTHPSGKERIDSLKKYIRDIENTNEEISFRKRFIDIWEMSSIE